MDTSDRDSQARDSTGHSASTREQPPRQNTLVLDDVWFEPEMPFGIDPRSIDIPFLMRGVSASFESGRLGVVTGDALSAAPLFFSFVYGAMSSEVKTAGLIAYNGEPRDPSKWVRQCGFVPADAYVIQELTVYENISFYVGCRTTLSADDVNLRTEEALKRLQLEGLRDTAAAYLSPSEEKLLMIVVELIVEPDVLLIEEPINRLDTQAAKRVLGVLKEYAERTNKIVAVNIAAPIRGIFKMVDDVYAFHGGVLLFGGSVDQMKEWLASHSIEPTEDLMAKAGAVVELFASKPWKKMIKKYKLARKRIIEQENESVRGTAKLRDPRRVRIADYSLSGRQIRNIIWRGTVTSCRAHWWNGSFYTALLYQVCILLFGFLISMAFSGFRGANRLAQNIPGVSTPEYSVAEIESITTLRILAKLSPFLPFWLTFIVPAISGYFLTWNELILLDINRGSYSLPSYLAALMLGELLWDPVRILLYVAGLAAFKSDRLIVCGWFWSSLLLQTVAARMLATVLLLLSYRFERLPISGLTSFLVVALHMVWGYFMAPILKVMVFLLPGSLHPGLPGMTTAPGMPIVPDYGKVGWLLFRVLFSPLAYLNPVIFTYGFFVKKLTGRVAGIAASHPTLLKSLFVPETMAQAELSAGTAEYEYLGDIPPDRISTFSELLGYEIGWVTALCLLPVSYLLLVGLILLLGRARYTFKFLL